MKCGFFELDITPLLGSVIPGDFGARYASEILDPLFVRAIAVRSGDMSLAIASIDACGITADVAEKIRTRVCGMIPMQPEQILVMATHTHGGGPTLNWGEYVIRSERYLDFLAAKAADSIVCAWNKAADSELLLGKEDLYGVSFIRDYRMKDGTLKTNPGPDPDILEPTTTIDPEVLVLGVRQNGAYVGAVVNFANHPATVATTQVTGDYISSLSAEMKRLYGPQFVTVFINGACGNINHIDPFDPQTRTKDRYRVVGIAIAQKAFAAMEKALPMTDETLRAQWGDISVKLRKPSGEQLLAAKKLFDDKGDDLSRITRKTPGYMEFFFAQQALWAQANRQTHRQVVLQVFRIGSCYIFGTPIQMFVQFGKKLKAACEGAAFVSAFSNDYCGYVPTPDCMERPGLYEFRLATSSCLEPAAGDMVCDAAIELYKKCK